MAAKIQGKQYLTSRRNVAAIKINVINDLP